MWKKFYLTILSMVLLPAITPPQVWGQAQDEPYVEPGEEWYHEELTEGECYDGIFYTYASSDLHEHAVSATSPLVYKEGGYGGYYSGELVIPSEMYGYEGKDLSFSVVGLIGMYKNGLTGLYLPESIESIGNTIKECRFLQKVILNNSLKELDGIKDCPLLAICPLPYSLERIGDGWMSGIAITEALFPDNLTTIGNDVFCNNPNLTDISLGNLKSMGENCFSNLPSLKEIALPESIQVMGSGCFSNCDNLESVSLPATEIPLSNSFNNCPAIHVVSVSSEIPYPFPDNCMTAVDKSKCTLYVPEGCEEVYSQADGWKDFGQIIPSVNLNVGSISGEGTDWRAFSFGGSLIIDCTRQSYFDIISVGGAHINSLNCDGRTELTLPAGLYIVKSGNKSIKVIL